MLRSPLCARVPGLGSATPPPSAGLRRPRSTRRSGFSLIEMTLAASILFIAISSLSGTVVSSVKLAQVNEEAALANDALRAAAERVQSVPFADIFATFNSDPSDDPGGVGTAAGNNFEAFGLPARSDDADGFVGEIVFSTSSVGGTQLALREDLLDESLGLPRDLNADGDIDALDHSSDYVLLPVTIRLNWAGVVSNRSMELNLLLIDQ